MSSEKEFLGELIDYLEQKWEEMDEAEMASSGAQRDYRSEIVARAMRKRGEWKLRKKQEKPKGQSKPTTPKTSPSSPKPRADHGTAPQAPAGEEYYWYEPKSNEGA
jgi:hypothetical protein